MLCSLQIRKILMCHFGNVSQNGLCLSGNCGVREGVELKEKCHLKKLKCYTPFFHLREVWACQLWIYSTKEGIVNYKGDFSFSLEILHGHIQYRREL